MNKLNTVRLIEAEGFRDGSQDVKPAAALEEINNQFARLREEEKIRTADTIKTLEGKLDNLEQRKFDADRHWADLESQTAGMPPPIILAFCAVIFSGIVVIGETVFLAPVMDGFGIADPIWQYLLSAVIVLVCSGLLEITKQQWQPLHEKREQPAEGDHAAAPNWPKMAFLSFINLLALLLVSVLGWWRAEEMIFAASAQSGGWQGFLANNATLTRIVVVLLTVSLPVFVAMAFDWGISGLRFAWEWRKARRAYKKYTAESAKTRKLLESEEEKTESRRQALEEMREEWRQSYLQNHELGEKVGARQVPLWQVVIKLAAVVLLVFVACLLVDPLLSAYVTSDGARYLIYACLVLGVGGVYGAHSLKVWDRPDANQLFRQKAVNWRREPDEKAPLFEAEKAGSAVGGGTAA